MLFHMGPHFALLNIALCLAIFSWNAFINQSKVKFLDHICVIRRACVK